MAIGDGASRYVGRLDRILVLIHGFERGVISNSLFSKAKHYYSL
jgi:hypothetical protein